MMTPDEEQEVLRQIAVAKAELERLNANVTSAKSKLKTALQEFSVATLTIIAVVCLHGWVLTWLWQWFVMPLFPVRAIGIAEGIGLSMVFRFMGTTAKAEKGDIRERLATPFAVLLFGWIVHQWV